MIKKNIPTVSVVIATLGGGQLFKTVHCLNAGNMIPVEILICIPEQYSPRVGGIQGSNIKVIKTNYMGQVAQRAEGFRQAKADFVMQLDDDIELEQNSLEHMVSALCHLGKKNVVGPVYLNNRSGLQLSPFPTGLRGALISFYYYIFGGLPLGRARMGCLSTLCVSSSIDSQLFKGDVAPTQWLAGGCILSHREDLIVENFYPFAGKAYAEDGLHSYLRTKKGIIHNVVLNAYAEIEVPSNALNWQDFVREMQIRKEIVKIMNGSILRKTIYIFAEFIRRLLWRKNLH